MSALSVVRVVRQHAEEAAILRNVRAVHVAAPHVRLHHLGRLDERIAAHLDGIGVAGGLGWRLCEAALETPGVGEVFAATVRAIEDRSSKGLDRLFALCGSIPEVQGALTSAFGWVSAQHLQGMSKALLTSAEPPRVRAGIAACALHRVDPGPALLAALRSADPLVRSRAQRAAGELGRVDVLPENRAALGSDEEVVRFWAAWSAVLLGDRSEALNVLVPLARGDSPFAERALAVLLRAADFTWTHEFLRALAKGGEQKPEMKRRLIRTSGIVGDPQYVPWLISLMADNKLARLAGESFSLITGADLAWLDLERKPPESVESGPSEDPDDNNVALDEDESLPWPDQTLIGAWWHANQHRFPPGTRSFMGAPVTRENCIRVLKEGYQRQRIAAALWLKLLEPRAPLFEWRAPAWRQQRWLARMG